MADAEQPLQFFQVRGACDLRCAWCNFRGEHPAEAPYELDRLRKALGEQRAQGRTGVGLGYHSTEPTTHPDFPAIVRHARELGFTRVCLSTSGIRIAERAYLEELVRQGITEVVLSFASLDEAISDRLLGVPGATANKLTALEHCLALGVRASIIVMFLRPVLHSLADGVARLRELCQRAAPSPGGSQTAVIGCYMDFVHSMSRRRIEALWPRFGEVAWTMREVQARSPAFELHGSELPSCVLEAIPGTRGVARSHDGLVGVKPDEVCGACATRGECAGIHPCYLKLEGSLPLLPPGILVEPQREIELPPLAPLPDETRDALTFPDPQAPWQVPIQTLLERRRAAAVSQGKSFRVESFGFVRDRVEVKLRSDSEHLELYLERREESARYFVAGPRLALSYKPETPIDNPEKKHGAVDLLRLLERGL